MKVYHWLLALLFVSCVNSETKTHTRNEVSYIDSLIYPEDSVAFKNSVATKKMDLKTFRPDTAYIKSIELELDGRKSSGTEAVLFYEEHVYGKILEEYMDEGFPKGDYKKEDFAFGWLDDNLKAELELSKPDYKGNPDIFLGTNGKAKLWFLDKKVLVKLDY